MGVVIFSPSASVDFTASSTDSCSRLALALSCSSWTGFFFGRFPLPLSPRRFVSKRRFKTNSDIRCSRYRRDSRPIDFTRSTLAGCFRGFFWRSLEFLETPLSATIHEGTISNFLKIDCSMMLVSRHIIGEFLLPIRTFRVQFSQPLNNSHISYKCQGIYMHFIQCNITHILPFQNLEIINLRNDFHLLPPSGIRFPIPLQLIE